MTHIALPRFNKALVTGGAGFIGSHIVSVLVDMRCPVIVVDNLNTGKKENLDHLGDRIEFVTGDIRDKDLMIQCAQDCDVVFHQAAVVSVPKSVEDPIGSARVNDMGTLMVLEAARQAGVNRVVLASSSAVYGEEPTLPKTEEMRPEPKSPYALQKWIDEQWAELYQSLYGLETACLRYFNVYGPRQDPGSPYSGVISIFMDRAVSGKSPYIYGDGEQTRDFVYVEDVVKANLLAATAKLKSNRIFNIGTGHRVSIRRLWETIAQLTKSDVQAHYAPERFGDIRHSVADIGLARQGIGFFPSFDFEEGISLTKEWYLRNRPII